MAAAFCHDMDRHSLVQKDRFVTCPQIVETEVQPKRWGASKKAAALEARLRQAPLTRDPAELRLRNACWAELAQHCAREEVA